VRLSFSFCRLAEPVIIRAPPKLPFQFQHLPSPHPTPPHPPSIDNRPENVFIDEDGCVVLGDFGLAINRVCERPVSRVGTAGFIAPEVLAQPSAEEAAELPKGWIPTYDEKVDIWSLGALLVEALTGHVPFAHANPDVAALKARYQGPPELPPGASAACVDFVHSVLQPDPHKRPSALQLLRHPWLAASPAAAAWCAPLPCGEPEWQRHLRHQLQQQAEVAGWHQHWQHCYQPHQRCGYLSPEPSFSTAPVKAQVSHAACEQRPQSPPPAAADAPAAESLEPSWASAEPASATAGRAQHRRAVFDSVDSFSEPLELYCNASGMLKASAAAKEASFSAAKGAASAPPRVWMPTNTSTPAGAEPSGADVSITEESVAAAAELTAGSPGEPRLPSKSRVRGLKAFVGALLCANHIEVKAH